MHRRAVFVDITTCAQECMGDRADRNPASTISINPICNFEQLRHRGFRIGERMILFEFHVSCFLGELVARKPALGLSRGVATRCTMAWSHSGHSNDLISKSGLPGVMPASIWHDTSDNARSDKTLEGFLG